MTTDQRRRSAAVLTEIVDSARHTTDLAARMGAYGITSDPILTLAELLAFDVEERKAVWLTLDRSTKVAIAMERLTEKELFFDRTDIEVFIAGLDAKAEAAREIAEARELAAAQRVGATALQADDTAAYCYWNELIAAGLDTADDSQPITERIIDLAPGGHELDDGDVKAGYWAALHHPEMQSARWQNALRKGFDHLEADRFVVSIGAGGGYLWWADDNQGGDYVVTPSTCQCTAFRNGEPCRHRGAAIILSLLPRG